MKCTFCGVEISKGIGKIYATKEGTVYYFCSSKCEKNKLKLKRKQQKVRWTSRFKEEKQIRLHGKEVKKEKVAKKVKEKAGTKKDRRAARKTEKKKVEAVKKKKVKELKKSGAKKEEPKKEE